MLKQAAWLLCAGLLAACSQPPESPPAPNPLRNPYFGDLHIHTAWSLDSLIIFNRNTPRDAYRFARGEEIEFYGRPPDKPALPLDFAAVTEHSEFLGETLLCEDPTTEAYHTALCADLRNEQQDPALENKNYRNVLLKIFTAEKPERLPICGPEGRDCMAAARTRWEAIRQIADEFYHPGEFTTFVGYEWTGEQGGNRHRNVIFRNNTVPETPWSMIEVPTVEGLWRKLDEECLPPCDVLTISHNPNLSKGKRFAGVNADGTRFTKEEAAYRALHEPLVEIMQFKGESECRFGVGTDDEFCNFEKYDLRPVCPDPPRPGSSLQCAPVCDAAGGPPGCVSPHNYVRNGLKTGLKFQEEVGANPYQLGLVASTDAHNANPGDTDEEAHHGHFGYLDADPEDRLLLALASGFKQLPRNPGGLAGVWAEENTRDSIFDALRRRETFGTSGNRNLLRFFGGWNYPERLAPGTNLAALGYRHGAPMGAELPPPSAAAPRFLAWARQAVDGERLQRLQIIKGWVEEGRTRERVYDVACSDGLAPAPDTNRCSDNGAWVDLKDCSVAPDRGAEELQAVWEDPDFDAREPAFYYLRVLENPRCRWSTRDALRLGRAPPPDVEPTILERAWSSPIWHKPAPGKEQPIQRQAYFGDLHVHTAWSLDSYINLTRAGPRAAYRFARGEPVELTGGRTAQLERPLDFAAVTEHAEYLGELRLCTDETSPRYALSLCRDIRNEAREPGLIKKVFSELIIRDLVAPKPRREPALCGADNALCLAKAAEVWRSLRAIADEFNQPGEFTTFAGYEWAGNTYGHNLHRNVIYKNSDTPDLPVSYFEANTPERLWRQLREGCVAPCEVLAIPHNSNQSRGWQFRETDRDGNPLGVEQARLRMETEPVVELIQAKGESECYTGLGTEDELCRFEKLESRPVCAAAGGDGAAGDCVRICADDERGEDCVWAGDYVRSALKRGLKLEARLGVNPFKLGFIGGTDTHNAAPGATDETNYHGHHGVEDGSPAARAAEPEIELFTPQRMKGSGGLAGLWAEENTRASLFAALKRRETFATSGARIKVRFFGGWDFPATLDEAGTDLAALGYSRGAPMGGDLPPRAGDGPPAFIVQAVKDPNGANLQRLQVVKGWLEQGEERERVYDVACSDGMVPSPDAHRCPDNGARVDLRDCSATLERGAAELKTLWRDPDFDESQPAFYYARVLENPTCRWSTWEALREGKEPFKDVPPVQQERAWSSPIWRQPAAGS